MTDPTSRLRDAKVLVVDDVPANVDVLLEALEGAGYTVFAATDGEAALRVAARERPDLILMDVEMPRLDGLEACRRLRAEESTRSIPVIFLTVRDDTEGVIEGLRAGAVDYVVKPYRREEVLARVRTHLEHAFLERALAEKNTELHESAARLREAYDRLQASHDAAEALNKRLEAEIARRESLDNRLAMISEREDEHWGVEGIIGRSPTVQRILKSIGLAQNASAISVLVTGESGTGKELVARAIHRGSARADGPFVAVNCATIPTDLAESLLFGHLRGAFTGADRQQVGYFELADGGTLFLDEIGTMPAIAQPKLLRVLEDGYIRPLGASEDRRVDVRVVAATNASFDAFREDLYFRLARFTVEVPPLRERREDVALLARHFLRMFAVEMGIEPPALSDEALEQLESYDFPGNVRELKNMVERALIESGGARIEPGHLHGYRGPAIASRGTGTDPDPIAFDDMPVTLADAEMALIHRAVTQANGNISQAARALGIDRNKIYRKLAQDRRSRSR